MDENSLSGWSALSGSSPYSADNASLQNSQMMSNQMMGAQMGGITAPQMQNNYGGAVAPSAVNGYPMFSSSQAGNSVPSGYANANPIDATPSVIQQQARMGTAPTPALMNPAQAAAPTMNPWNFKQSSVSGAFDYPLPGTNTIPPRIATT